MQVSTVVAQGGVAAHRFSLVLKSRCGCESESHELRLKSEEQQRFYPIIIIKAMNLVVQLLLENINSKKKLFGLMTTGTNIYGKINLEH